MEQLINSRIDILIEKLIENYTKGFKERRENIDFECVQGKKYIKIIMTNYGGRSVHAFVDATTGYLYKPASWKAPARHIRYKLLDDTSFNRCLERANWAGGYLYM